MFAQKFLACCPRSAGRAGFSIKAIYFNMLGEGSVSKEYGCLGASRGFGGRWLAADGQKMSRTARPRHASELLTKTVRIRPSPPLAFGEPARPTLVQVEGGVLAGFAGSRQAGPDKLVTGLLLKLVGVVGLRRQNDGFGLE